MAVAKIAGNFDRATNPNPTDFEHEIYADIGWLRHIPNINFSHTHTLWKIEQACIFFTPITSAKLNKKRK